MNNLVVLCLLQATGSQTSEEDLSMRRSFRRLSEKIGQCDLTDLRIRVMEEWQKLHKHYQRTFL